MQCSSKLCFQFTLGPKTAFMFFYSANILKGSHLHIFPAGFFCSSADTTKSNAAWALYLSPRNHLSPEFRFSGTLFKIEKRVFLKFPAFVNFPLCSSVCHDSELKSRSAGSESRWAQGAILILLLLSKRKWRWLSDRENVKNKEISFSFFQKLLENTTSRLLDLEKCAFSLFSF